ncbi:uncharacterized protein JCM15063_004784 [Sporobolomyces koalae]|uniref:uncharacterized protein n=1 Tax=Sporobolomyces koalae TaxID=500713 RepID=UPI00317212FA
MTQVSSAADLTASLRRTSGTRPPPLVGCSVTLLGDAVYVFGGRLVPTRTMVSTLYRLDLRTLEWTLVSPEPTADEAPTVPPPRARYFHSCCPWGQNKLVIFGGEGYDSSSESTSTREDPDRDDEPPALQTLNDLHVFNCDTLAWEQVGPIKLGPGLTEIPKPRYAHLGVVCTATADPTTTLSSSDEPEPVRQKSCLMIMGGQDIRNTYLHSTDVLDLETMTWIQTGKWDRHIGTYRAIATTSNVSVKPGGPMPVPPLSVEAGASAETNLRNLSFTVPNDVREPEPILLFSNFNFTQVRRDLDLLTSPLSTSKPLDPLSLSASMTGSSLPPGLRFPSGFQLGHHLIIFGTFLSQHLNNFAIWALELGPQGAIGIERDRGARRNGANLEINGSHRSGSGTLEWMRIDPGNVLQKGSWNRAVGWKNNVVVLGDRERDIAADYDHRQTNFTHVAFIDLEAHGIYQPLPQPLPPLAQSFGLLSLEQPFLSDFEIVCSDNARIACSRKVLEDRWRWFDLKLQEFKIKASGVVAAQQKRAQDASIENSEVGSLAGDSVHTKASTTDSLQSPTFTKTSSARSTTTTAASTEEARLTPRTLVLPEPKPVVLAFLQYLYTLTLCTPLQLELPILSALLLFSVNYEEDNLRALVVHALHEHLSKDPSAAPTVYEAATLGGCTALQIRALKTLMSAPRHLGHSGPSNGNVEQTNQAEPMARQASQDVHGLSQFGSATHSARRSDHSTASFTAAANRLSSISSYRRISFEPPASPAPVVGLPSTPSEQSAYELTTGEDAPSRSCERLEDHRTADISPETSFLSLGEDSIAGFFTSSTPSIKLDFSFDSFPTPSSRRSSLLNFRLGRSGQALDFRSGRIQEDVAEQDVDEPSPDPVPSSPATTHTDYTDSRSVSDGSSGKDANKKKRFATRWNDFVNPYPKPLQQAQSEEEWHPVFFNAVKSSGTESNPVSTREPTRLDFDLLDNEQRVFDLSPRLHSATLSNRSIPSSTDHHNHDTKVSTSSLLSHVPTVPPASVAMTRDRSFSSTTSAGSRSQDGSDLITPPTAFQARFDPPRIFDSDTRGLSEHEFAQYSPRSNLSSSPATSPKISQSSSNSSSTAPRTSGGSLSNLFSNSKKSTSGKSQKDLEIEIGTNLLRRAGASEKEISLRARSVGYEYLHRR